MSLLESIIGNLEEIFPKPEPPPAQTSFPLDRTFARQLGFESDLGNGIQLVLGSFRQVEADEARLISRWELQFQNFRER